MVKCVVSSCPNREQLSADRGFSRAPKRFFSLPQDPARIKVWLAALREPDTKDWTESHVICEDHFLPEDISMSGVNPDAIPIMPPCLEEQGINVWPEDPEEDDDGWAAGEQANEESEGEAEEDAEEDVNEEMQEDNEGEEEAAATVTDDTHLATETATVPPADRSPEATTELQEPNSQPERLLCHPKNNPVNVRSDSPLPLLTPQFLELLLKSDRSLDLHQAAVTLQSRRRCLYDITAVLKGLDLVQKESPSRVRWTGKCPISSFLWPKQKMQKESEKMRLVEETLDGLIKSCAQQLFQMTDDPSNARLAYVTLADVQNLPVFENQTVIVVKAPEETKLEVPAPKKDGIQIHLKSGSSPISVLACEVWPDGTKAEKGAFLHIQHSRIKTFPLQTESSSSQSTVPGL
ncbi:transcription factor E2F6 [Periophthalmus magnuspinnatus]|uniref:transcription factor E2F6 n=1 Tax=Periophthalmus magnuspinnatus TaxID=409849 RepID=UPI00145B2749|nr:transcription factor E2F6 [Periophthalmus magnuspinnatus]